MAWSPILSPQVQSVQKQRVNARSKGRRGEQEVANLLRAVVEECGCDLEIKRNQMQTAGKHRTAGQGDLVGLEWLSIEIKRVESDLPSSMAAWWAQTKAQCGPGQTPLLFHRMNGRDWNVRTLMDTMVGSQIVRFPVDMAWSIYRVWLKIALEERYNKSLE